jgi:hypothetical protein
MERMFIRRRMLFRLFFGCGTSFGHKAWALDGRPTPAVRNLNSTSRSEVGLKEPPKPEQVYDFSILDEVAKK